jgi:transcription elongation factor GreA
MAMDSKSKVEKYPLTKEGLSRLRKELRKLTEVKKENIKEQLSRAWEAGDERENDGFALAFEDFKINRERIHWMQCVLKNVQILDPKQNSVIELGHKVVLENENGDERTFQLVGDLEVNTMQNLITNRSSLGVQLIGKKVGDRIEIRNEKYRIKRIFV